jgi:hypothetical protein
MWTLIKAGILGALYCAGIYFGATEYGGPPMFIVLVVILVFRTAFIGPGLNSDWGTGNLIDFVICAVGLGVGYIYFHRTHLNTVVRGSGQTLFTVFNATIAELGSV